MTGERVSKVTKTDEEESSDHVGECSKSPDGSESAETNETVGTGTGRSSCAVPLVPHPQWNAVVRQNMTITTAAATTTATNSPVVCTGRRQSIIHSALAPRISCQPQPHSLDALDISSTSPAAAFASLHFNVLSCLADIETFLSQIESPLPDFDLGQAIAKGELKVEEVRAWAKDGLEILKQIKAELRSHLPEFYLDSTSVESYVSARLHDFSDASNLKRVTSRLPDLSHLPRPEHYVAILSTHLKSLHSHLSSSKALSHMGFPSFPSTTKLSELIDTMMASDRLHAVLRAPSMSWTEDALGRAAMEVARAIERSVHGAKLITYGDLPTEWRNNPFVTHGYRFVPLACARSAVVTHSARVFSVLYP